MIEPALSRLGRFVAEGPLDADVEALRALRTFCNVGRACPSGGQREQELLAAAAVIAFAAILGRPQTLRSRNAFNVIGG